MLKEIIPTPPHPPVSARDHVADTAPLPAIVPEHRRAPRLPFAPWRFLVMAAILIAAVPCGIAAAAPGINGAELALGILLVGFVGVYAIPGKDIR